MTTLETTARNRISAACLGVPMPLPHFAPAAARMLFALLRRVEHGELLVHTPAGTTHRFGTAQGERGEFTFRDWRLPRRVLTGGDVAFAEGYVDGLWDTPDLVALLTLLARNQPVLESAFYGRGWQQALFRLRHWLHANTRRQAKRNIVAHYDLGNAFYARWLDPSMTYSSALFGGNFALSTEAAQTAKYRRILDELSLASGSHLLEIGAGWGGFAELAGRAGHRVTGLSLSDAQTAYARARIDRAGLAERVGFALRDYRDERGTYDGVASIEMFEAVGERWWPDYFAALRRVLRPGARAAIQTITIADERFERYRTQSDFIQQYIFPGGMLASPSRFAGEAMRAGFAIESKLDFGRDYAQTLRRWLAAFDDAAADLRADGFDERFIRCWRFYLAYCAAGFDSGTIDVSQYTLGAR